MINKLRRRFLLTSMLAVGIILAVLVTGITVLGYCMIVNRLDQRIAAGETQYLEKGKGSEQRGNPFWATEHPLFWIAEYDTSGTLLYLTDTPDVHQRSRMEKTGQAVWLAEKETGFYEGCRFRKKTIPEGTRILFIDSSRSLTQFSDSVQVEILMAAIACGIVFLILRRVSHWVVHPYVHSYESQKRFVANVSHDLKTPLTVIRADADVLSGTLKDNRWLADIGLQAGKMSELVEEMLLLSRMQEKGSAQMWVDFPISDIIEEEAQMFVQMAEVKNRAYTFSVEPMLTCHGDPKAIRHLAGVLLDNAIKYSQENGTVRLELREKGSSLVLTVYNSVDHISRDELPNLTERFYRADSARSLDSNSHGIGLAIAEEIVRAHHGEMTLSTADERSFLVTVKL